MKEWTLMFYFASDNPLAPGIVSQLKTLKNAGYHHEANVVAYFDPEPAGTPAHIFDVNAIYKLENPKPDIGFASNDPFVRNLMEDRLWGNEMSRDGKTKIRDRIIKLLKDGKGLTYDLPELPPPPSQRSASSATDGHAGATSNGNSEPGPKDSLQSFLNFCADRYPAKHYMLFILGHGLVVGDDVFLYDEHAAKQSVTLRELREALVTFKANIRGGEFELISFHSCSMSSLEVAYELQDTAKYMLSSQGPAFVGSWPYRQILIRVFNDLERKRKTNTEITVEEMLKLIFSYVYHNSTDYLLAGYSFDLCLCDLSIITDVRRPLKDLSDALVQGLGSNPLVTNCILLAHWKSQSYWQENYTDLYDFCFCLRKYCEEFGRATGDVSPYQRILDACKTVMDVLTKQSSEFPNNPIILAEFAGPGSQYSHGFSVFFPWSRPTADRKIMKDYQQYKFNQTTWFSFLDKYWGPEEFREPVEGSTMRGSHKDEDDPHASRAAASEDDNLREDIISLMFNAEGPLSSEGALNGPKVNPPDPTGDQCTCGSLKNYRRDTRPRRQRGKRPVQQIPLSSPIDGNQGAA
jgi:hypothetical protein